MRQSNIDEYSVLLWEQFLIPFLEESRKLSVWFHWGSAVTTDSFTVQYSTDNYLKPTKTGDRRSKIEVILLT